MVQASEIIRDVFYALELAVWIAAAILAIRMVRSNSTKGDRLFLVGVALVIFDLFIVVLTWISVSQPVLNWMTVNKWIAGSDELTPVLLGINVLRNCAYVTGIFLIVYAFWLKFKARP
ncbi:MAG: hypothetical protein ABSF74_01540 [Dehalococcoidia bacterium]|jgi:hypothetical protein